MKTLVLGSSGQLASHLREALSEATFWGRAERDLAAVDELEEAIVAAEPSVIVNAAAYTAVDRAESEPALAWLINATATAAIARAAAELDVPVVYVSTDYVFDGKSTNPYRESDPVGPVSAYGKSKLAGELAVSMLNPKHWIIRTSWVFSEFGSNFVKTMVRLGSERDRLRVVSDQRGVPTYAGHLARVIAALISPATEPVVPWGIHHSVGGPAVSWHEFAQTVIASAFRLGLISRQPLVEAITTAEYPTAAQRPANSVLAPSAALHRALGVEPYWPEGLEHTLAQLSTR